MSEAAKTSTYPAGPFLSLDAIMPAFEEDSAKRWKAYDDGEPRGPVTGFARLDALLGGALEPGLHVIHAGPGVGKTALAFQIATQCGCQAVYVSAEMRPVELLRRLTARHSRQYLGTLKSGERRPDVLLGLAQKAAATIGRRVSIVDATREGATVADVEKYATMAANLDERKRVLLVVDSLHSWAEGAAATARERQAEADAEEIRKNPSYRPTVAVRADSEYELMNWAIAALQKLSIRLDCPIIAIAERSRASADDSGMSAAASSRKFEYGAESVIGLKAKKKRDTIKPVWLTIAKNRHGEGYAETFLWFEGRLQEYEEMSENEAESVRAQWIAEDEEERKKKAKK